MSVIAIPEILEQKLTHKGAEALAMLLNSFEERAEKDILSESENRFEKRLITEIADVKSDFRAEIEKVKNELKTEIAEVKAELKTEIAHSEARLEGKIAGVKTDLIKWFVGIAFAQIAVLIAILSFIVR